MVLNTGSYLLTPAWLLVICGNDIFLLTLFIYFNNNSIQINVQGWRKPYSDSNYDLWYNKNTVKLSAHINNTNFPTSWEAFGADLKIASLGLKPNMPVIVPCYSPHNIFVAVRETDGKVYRVSKTGSTVNTSAYALLTWNY